jgi:hypothetical protein
MKNLLYILVVISLAVSFTSCQDEYEVEMTEPAEFAGEWFYEVSDTEGNLYMGYSDSYHSSTFLTYNSAANLPDEVFFDDQGVFLYFKSKFTLEGDKSGFSSSDVAINLYEYSVPDPMQVVSGTSVGDSTINIPYGLVSITDGKIIEDAATVWQDKEKATADSIYFQANFFVADFTFNAVADSTYEDEGISYDVYHFEPAENHYTYDEGAPESYVVSGHRKTGWEVYID